MKEKRELKSSKKREIKKSLFLGIIIQVIAFIIFASTSPAEAARKLVKVDGSSTVFPITEAVAEEFQIDTRGKVMVTVGVSGTGGGFKKFCRGEVDITNASREIKGTEKNLCKKNKIDYIELEVAYDGLAVMVNNKNTWVDYLTTKELKKIWEPKAKNKVVKWSDVREGWPSKPLTIFGPGTDSGTFDYFTLVINGKEGAIRSDFTASENDNVLVQGISTDPGSLGYFGLAYYEYNKDKLKIVPIDDGNDKNGKGAIIPTQKTVNNNTYAPLSRPIFIYVSKQALKKPEVTQFVKFYLNNAAVLSEEVGYIALPLEKYKEGLNLIK
ncbi:MAG: PstS family phosphate ABC transporter substrate-binding protein [Deltaproteobacteria bacterium]|nr:PstS family phosphate ABC transporter substrate-binding protein [Deltaproteobacteria bacterium]